MSRPEHAARLLVAKRPADLGEEPEPTHKVITARASGVNVAGAVTTETAFVMRNRN